MMPRATYRLQFHKDFTFRDAAEHVDYFAELEITHIYSSPILTARAGSRHGYDVVDHSTINPELGGEKDFLSLAKRLRGRDMGLIVDIVPNHMAVGRADNTWWLDVLQNGKGSAFAEYFDIDWDVLDGKVLAPFLGAPFEEALANGDLKLVFDQRLDKMAFSYFEHRFPVHGVNPDIDPRTFSAAELASLHAAQHFILTDWREADSRINWRRFFDITDLAALRAERSEVFDDTHGKIFQLFAEGWIDGVRVDHIDGLADPQAYCQHLRRRLKEAGDREPYVIVEKILAVDEELPCRWQTDGTTGYDFMNEISALEHDVDANDILETTWMSVAGPESRTFDEEERHDRTEILQTKFSAQLDAAVRALIATAICCSHSADIKPALIAIISQLRCYRSYATGRADSPGAGNHFRDAVSRAVYSHPELSQPIAAIFRTMEDSGGDSFVVDAVRHVNQLSAPVAAKAVEDTAFYRYGRLLSRNDVGFDPRQRTISIADFHASMIRRAQNFPLSMLTTATHDHKRGEDARARLAVLSEMPETWRDQATSWIAHIRQTDGDIEPADAYHLLQTLVGAWPSSEQLDATFAERIKQWSVKYLREAKLRSSWSTPDEDYERRMQQLIDRILLQPEGEAVRGGIEQFVERISGAALSNSLVQLVLRYTLPGVPDCYQGTEYLDLSMVDPDNRRAIDFARRQAFKDVRVGGGTHYGPDGQKMKSLQSLLALRARHAALFAEGEYAPLSVSGQRAGNVIAFTRTHKNLQAVVIAQLRCARALNSEAVTAKEWWGDTRIDGLPRLLQWWLPQLEDSKLISPNVADFLTRNCVAVAVGNLADPNNAN